MKKNVETRKDLLKAMHLLMQHMNNEDAYYNWIVTGVPDCPSEDDFESIAEDDEEFNETADLFMKIVHAYGKDGIAE